jgi:mRNA-degrading endonuclease toxin of MazEF toxin-antitoxin module
MRQFDVCRLKATHEQLVVVIQHDVTDELATRVVAPVSDRPFSQVMTHLRIPVDLDDGRYLILLDRMAAIESRMIGDVVGNLSEREREIKNGLDFLFFGV